MRKFIFIVTGLLFLAGIYLKADGVTFKASAPFFVLFCNALSFTFNHLQDESITQTAHLRIFRPM